MFHYFAVHNYRKEQVTGCQVHALPRHVGKLLHEAKLIPKPIKPSINFIFQFREAQIAIEISCDTSSVQRMVILYYCSEVSCANSF